MKKYILFMVLTLVLLLTSCTDETVVEDLKQEEDVTPEILKGNINSLDIDIDNYVSIGNIGDTQLYRLVDIPDAYLKNALYLTDYSDDQCTTGAQNRNFIMEYEDEFYYVDKGLSLELFTLEELYNSGVVVGCGYYRKELTELNRGVFNSELINDDEFPLGYDTKVIVHNEPIFEINGFEFYPANPMRTCFVFFNIIEDGYNFGPGGGCDSSLDGLTYVAVKDGYMYSIQELRNEGYLLTYDIYMYHLIY